MKYIVTRKCGCESERHIYGNSAKRNIEVINLKTSECKKCKEERK